MTKLLEEAVDAVRRMPPDVQDAIAKMLLSNVDNGAAEDIPAEHLPAVMEGLAQLERGEFIEGTAAELVETTFRRPRP